MIKVKVIERQREAQNIYSFELVAADGQKLPAFSAGSHIDVHLGEGLTRQYSLYNSPRDDHSYKIAVLLAPDSRGGSAAMHRLQVGQQVTISEPRNLFALSHGAGHSVLFAGGIGITPILCMAERLAQTGADFELHYYSRSAEHAAFAQYLRHCAYAERVQLYVDDHPQGKPVLEQLLANRGPGEHLYICGPNGFMNHVLGTARAVGWDDARLHREYFANEPAQQGKDNGFQVTLASSGQVFQVPPERSILQVLLEHDIQVPYSCEQGVCGTCVVRVLQGTPEHRDLYFSDSEKRANDQMLTCCSRSAGAHLVLDL